MADGSPKLTPAFERDILAKALRDTEFCSMLCTFVGNRRIFRMPQHNYFYQCIFKRWQQDRPLSRKVLRRILDKDRKISDKKKDIYYMDFKELQAKAVRDADFALAEIKEYFDMVQVKNVIDSFGDSILNGGDFYRELSNVKSSLAEIGVSDESESIDFVGNWEDRQAMRYERHRRMTTLRGEIDDNDFMIPTGIMQLDGYLYGGVDATKAAAVLTKPNVGKSIFLVNMAYSAMMNSYNVIIFTFEDVQSLVTTRLDARTLGIDFYKIKNCGMSRRETHEANRIMNQIKNSSTTGHVEIVECSSETMDELKHITHTKERELGLKFHQINIDYLDIVGYNGKATEERFKQKENCQAYKDWMKDEKRSGWTAIQAKVSADKTVLTKEDVSEAYDKAKILDIIFGLGENREMEAQNQMNGFLSKWREGESRQNIPLTAMKGLALITDYTGD